MTALDALADQVDAEVVGARRQLVEMARAAANESGIRQARHALAEGPHMLAEAQARYRAAQDAETAAKEAHDAELVAADWELDGRFTVEGNKTYLVQGEEKRAMTVDDRKAWKANEARKLPAVAEARRRLREAEQATAAARDGLTIAEKQLTVRRIDLEAAIAELNALAAVLPRKAD
jgi:hypothetical protein